MLAPMLAKPSAPTQLGAVDQLDHARAQAFQRDVLEGDFGAVHDQPRVLAQCDFVVDTAETGFFSVMVAVSLAASVMVVRMTDGSPGFLRGGALFFLCFCPIGVCAVARLIMECVRALSPWRYRFYYLDTIRYFPLFLLLLD